MVGDDQRADADGVAVGERDGRGNPSFAEERAVLAAEIFERRAVGRHDHLRVAA
jgi:hypothetical protein